MNYLAPLLLVALATPSAAAQAAPETSVSSTIKAVTVYSDRARVTREGAVALTPAAKTFAFKGLPGWVDDSSVRAGTSVGRIVDVRVQRTFLARASDESYRSAQAAVGALEGQVATLDDELAVLAAQAKQIRDIRAFSLAKVSKDTAIRDVSVESYGKVVTFISTSLRATAAARRKVVLARAKLTPELAQRRAQLKELRSLMKLEQTTVLVTIRAPRAAQSKLTLTYMLPGATWEPTHELRAAGADPTSVEVTSFAVVTQTSGEDWTGAQLSFSTQSATQRTNIPELDALRLGDVHTATRMYKQQHASYSRAEQAFKGQNLLWNKRRQKKSTKFESVYRSNFQYLETVQSKTVRIFKGLQNRGTTAHFSAMARSTVRGDGHSVRLRIGTARLKSKQKVVAAPEQSLNAARTLEMTNSTPQPLLPGSVALYQDGAFLGMTSMNFISTGERFAVFLNVADQLKLSRVLDKKHSSLVRKTRTRMTVAFIVTVENLADQPIALMLADRVPVSENRDVRIDKVSVQPGATKDSKGLLHWDVTLKAREKRTFRISYRIEYPPTLVLETRRKQRRQRKPRPGKRRKKSLNEKIMNMQDMF